MKRQLTKKTPHGKQTGVVSRPKPQPCAGCGASAETVGKCAYCGRPKP